MRSFIIHMRDDGRRAPNAARLAAFLPDAVIVDAVVGADAVGPGLPATRPGDLHAPAYPFPPAPAEIGCFLSHRACWQRILDEGHDFALIVEDDMDAVPELWPATMRLIARHAGPESYIRLPAKARETPAAAIAEEAGVRLFLPRIIGLQTVAQVVGRNAARRLLAASETIDRPVDAFLQMHWITGQPVHTILPSPVRELTAELGGSTVQTGPPPASRLRRELLRTWYRIRIARRPQRVAKQGR